MGLTELNRHQELELISKHPQFCTPFPDGFSRVSRQMNAITLEFHTIGKRMAAPC